MRNVLLVARRDYLGYVLAWGFWFGLLLTPGLLLVGLLAPSAVISSQPTKYFTVIEAEGAVFADAMDAEFERGKVQAVRAQLAGLELAGAAPEDALAAFDEAIAAGRGIEGALAAADAPASVTPPGSAYARVPAPAATPEALRPYLLGDRFVDTSAGPQPLFAAIIVPAEGEIEYWSENVTAASGRLLNDVRAVARQAARTSALAAVGAPADLIQTADASARGVVERRARPQTAGGGGEVTMADRAPFIVSVFIAFLLWMLIFSVVNYLLMGTIEERSNKIFDTLLTSVRLNELLAGKLLAVLAVALTLMGTWGLGASVMTLGFGHMMPQNLANGVAAAAAAATSPAILAPAIVSFILGYMMYGAIFLALGSLCDTIQEAQTLMSPVIILLMAPLFMIILAISDPASPILGGLSWVPFFTPFLLIMRMPTEPPLFEVFGQLGLMAATALVILWFATKVYRAGAVHGAGVNDALRWIRRFGRPAPVTDLRG